MERINIYKAVYKVNHAGGAGSCFYLKDKGFFVTNYHVVEGFRQVALHDEDKNYFLADVVLVNPKLDIALLRADGDFSHLPQIVLPQDGGVQIGQRINVCGFPYGMPFTVTEGTVSAPRQLVKGNYYIQTDAAVNPGNSGGPMFNENNELIGVTVSKIQEADNMGFGIPVATLCELFDNLEEIDSSAFHVQCAGCDALISEEEEYCSSCGDKLPKEAFQQRKLTDLALFCEEAIRQLDINPILARVGQESWTFHKGSSEIRMFVYSRAYLFCTSPINILPKKNLEPVLTYMLTENMKPYQIGVEGNQIFISYRIHISDVFSDFADTVRENITGLAHKADDLDNFLAEEYGCEFSQYAKKDAI